MKLNYECFSESFLGLVCERFGKSLSKRESAVYFRKFSIYSDETFAELCDRAFDLDFFPSVDWFKRQYEELSERSHSSEPLSLPSAKMKELENMSAEECAQNFIRFRALLNNAARMPPRRLAEKPQPARLTEIPEDFRKWLETQPAIVNAPESDCASLLRIMSVSPRIRSEFMEEQEW